MYIFWEGFSTLQPPGRDNDLQIWNEATGLLWKSCYKILFLFGHHLLDILCGSASL